MIGDHHDPIEILSNLLIVIHLQQINFSSQYFYTNDFEFIFNGTTFINNVAILLRGSIVLYFLEINSINVLVDEKSALKSFFLDSL